MLFGRFSPFCFFFCDHNTIHCLSHCPFSLLLLHNIIDKNGEVFRPLLALSPLPPSLSLVCGVSSVPAIVLTNFHHQIGNWLRLFLMLCEYMCACVFALRTPKRRLRFIVIVLYVKWHLKINLWFNCQVLCVCVCFDCCYIVFVSLFPHCTHTHTGEMGCTWKEKTKITTTTTASSTAATHSIQGEAAKKQVFKFIVRHYYSLIRLGAGFCFLIFIFACSLQKNVMSAWGTIFFLYLRSFDRDGVSIDPMPTNGFAVCRHNSNQKQMCDRQNRKSHQQHWNNNNQMY